MLSAQVCINTLRDTREVLTDGQIIALLTEVIDVQLRDDGDNPYRCLGDRGLKVHEELKDMIELLERSMSYCSDDGQP